MLENLYVEVKPRSFWTTTKERAAGKYLSADMAVARPFLLAITVLSLIAYLLTR